MFHSYRDRIRTPKPAEKPTSTTVFNCDMCNKGGWFTENDVEIHKKNAHFLAIARILSEHLDRFCTVCMKLLESSQDLISHIKSEHLLSSPKAKRVERQIYICNECTHIFFNKDVLAVHMMYVHLSSKETRKTTYFTCPKCFENPKLYSVWFHFQKHNIPSLSLCDICLTNLESRKELLEHIKTHKSYFFCEPCGYNSTKEELFETHLKLHEERPTPRNCTDPPSELLNNVILKPKTSKIVRYNIHNAVQGLYLPKNVNICTLCREICLTQEEVNLHIIRDHMPEASEKRKHLCVCGEEFNHKIVLKQHILKNGCLDKPIEEPAEVESQHENNQDNTISEENVQNSKSIEYVNVNVTRLARIDGNNVLLN